MRIVCRPLQDWPGALRDPWQRDPGHRFRAGWQSTTELLEREAEMIGGDQVVIQLTVEEADLRRDGWPRANTRPRHPGVTVVVPETDHGRLSWSTDRYADWTKNVRAIALSMEALRAADRHGVMQGRQYAGFRELGSGESDTPRFATVEDAARFIAEHSPASSHKILLADPNVLGDAYRRAAKRLHPDTGGHPHAFQQLQQAKRMLDDHGGGA